MSSSYCDQLDPSSCTQQQQRNEASSVSTTNSPGLTTLLSATSGAFSVSDILHCPQSYDIEDNRQETIIDTCNRNAASALLHDRSSFSFSSQPASSSNHACSNSITTPIGDDLHQHQHHHQQLQQHQHQYPCGNVEELLHLHHSSAPCYHQTNDAGLVPSCSPQQSGGGAWYAAMAAGYGDDLVSSTGRMHHCKLNVLTVEYACVMT
jgi:hypothetical protein